MAYQSAKAPSIAQLIDIWTTHFREEYPVIQEQAPFVMPVESLGGRPSGPAVSLQLSPNPVAPRFWMLDESRYHLVQLQQDFVAFNWRKLDADADYPRYSHMRDEFASAMAHVATYLGGHELGDFVPTQAEISYINHVQPVAPATSVHLDHVIKGYTSREVPGLQEVESERMALSYRIYDGERHVGRLHVAAEPVVRRKDDVSMMALTLTARGLPLERSADGVLDFLNLGSEVAMDAFTGLTRDEVQAEWGRR